MSPDRTLFVETNFLVGHARGELEAYETILGAAEAGRIQLVVPVFAIYEAFGKVRREQEPRERWASELDEVGKELERKRLNPARADALQRAAEHLRGLVDDHRTGLLETTRRVRSCASLIEVVPAQIDDALEFQNRLKKGDPWVCASLRHALGGRDASAAVFLTKDSDFADAIDAWSRRPPSPQPLLTPFAGLTVEKHPNAVVSRWQLKAE